MTLSLVDEEALELDEGITVQPQLSRVLATFKHGLTSWKITFGCFSNSRQAKALTAAFSPLHLKLLTKSNQNSYCKNISTLDSTPAVLTAHAQRGTVTSWWSPKPKVLCAHAVQWDNTVDHCCRTPTCLHFLSLVAARESVWWSPIWASPWRIRAPRADHTNLTVPVKGWWTMRLWAWRVWIVAVWVRVRLYFTVLLWWSCVTQRV